MDLLEVLDIFHFIWLYALTDILCHYIVTTRYLEIKDFHVINQLIFIYSSLLIFSQCSKIFYHFQDTFQSTFAFLIWNHKVTFPQWQKFGFLQILTKYSQFNCREIDLYDAITMFQLFKNTENQNNEFLFFTCLISKYMSFVDTRLKMPSLFYLDFFFKIETVWDRTIWMNDWSHLGLWNHQDQIIGIGL